MTEEELESYSNVLHMLEPTADLLEMLRTYEGCGEYIRQVIIMPHHTGIPPACHRGREQQEVENDQEET